MSDLYYHEEMREQRTLEEWKEIFGDFGEPVGYKTFEEWQLNHLTSEKDYHKIERL